MAGLRLDLRDEALKKTEDGVIPFPGVSIKGGITFGNTDELGYAAVDHPVGVHDYHATMRHLLDIDHLRMTVKFQGLDARLTGVTGEVVKAILARGASWRNGSASSLGTQLSLNRSCHHPHHAPRERARRDRIHLLRFSPRCGHPAHVTMLDPEVRRLNSES
ncbi:MAG: DUF1501 domain-containing protein [Acidobacteria bacterium]|nr:DUF1501 domain-containing protein [Acidobacteriota bacterium]